MVIYNASHFYNQKVCDGLTKKEMNNPQIILMDNKRELGDELTSNKAVQTGGATLFVAAHVGVSTATTAGVGAVTAGKAGLILAGLGPCGIVIGGCLLFGGVAKVLIDRYKERNGK